MKLKITNKFNILPIIVYLLWVVFVMYFFFFKIYSFSNEFPCGAGYMMIGMPIMTFVFTLVSLLLVAVINLFSRKKYYVDFEFISIPFFVMVGIFIATIFF